MPLVPRGSLRPIGSTLRRGGAAATELALALPLFALLFAIAVDYCRVFYITQTVQNSAWVGAMYASGTASNPSAATTDDAAKQAAVADAVSLNPALDPSQVTVSYQNGNATVTVQYQFQALTPLMGEWGKVTITRTATLAMAPTGP